MVDPCPAGESVGYPLEPGRRDRDTIFVGELRLGAVDNGDPGASGYLVVDPGTPEQRSVPIYDSLFLGRECHGIDPTRRYLIEDESISRIHAEIRLPSEQGPAWVTDTSTNGTRVNGHRIERGKPTPIVHGDRLQMGSKDLEFRSNGVVARSGSNASETVEWGSSFHMVMAVGDIVAYSTISQYTEDDVLMKGLAQIYGDLRRLLAQHKGTLSNYVGDAFFATWEIESVPDAAAQALSFALDATDKVQEIAPLLPLRDSSGMPVRMGWGISSGRASIRSLAGRLTVLGDNTNVAFRLSGVAARNQWADVVVTEAVHDRAAGPFLFTGPFQVEVKGRTGKETVYGVARQA